MQMVGRVHRAGQLSLPRFVTTSVSDAEKRFASSVSLRLKQLGALTSGDQRDDGAGLNFAGEEFLSAAGNRAAKSFAVSGRGCKDGKQLLNRTLAITPQNASRVIDKFAAATQREMRVDVQKGRVAPAREELNECSSKVIMLRRFTHKSGMDVVTFRVDKRLTWEDVLQKKKDIDDAGNSTTRFGASHAADCAGTCLIHFRPGINAARCHFVDGSVASVIPDKLQRFKMNEALWSSAYNAQRPSEVSVALVPCLEAMRRLHKPPKVYRVTLEAQAGNAPMRRLAVEIGPSLASALRRD